MNKRQQERAMKALIRLRNAAKNHGEALFFGDLDYDDDEEKGNATGEEMIRAIEQADRTIAALATPPDKPIGGRTDKA